MSAVTPSPIGRSRRELAAGLLATPPVRQAMRRLPRWSGILVLNYHRVGDRDAQPWDHAVFNADAATFDAQVAALDKSADIVALRDVAELVRRGRRGRKVLLTFDDGYRDNFEVAYPILQRHGAPAAFFVATGFLDRPHVPWWDEVAWMVRNAVFPAIVGVPDDAMTLSLTATEIDATIETLITHYKELPGEQTESYLEQIAVATGSGRCDAAAARELWMSWDMVRELRYAGMDIGGHSDSHPILARMPVAEQEREIDLCARRLAEELGARMRWFAYPVGARDSFTPQTRRVLGDHGVELAFSFYGGFANFDSWSPMDVPRVHVPYGATTALLEAMLGLPRLLARW